jgi:hypothetical protein
VVVIAVTAVLMAILQAVLPSTDSEASGISAAEPPDDDAATDAEAEDPAATSVR